MSKFQTILVILTAIWWIFAILHIVIFQYYYLPFFDRKHGINLGVECHVVFKKHRIGGYLILLLPRQALNYMIFFVEDIKMTPFLSNIQKFRISRLSFQIRFFPFYWNRRIFFRDSNFSDLLQNNDVRNF